MGVLRLATREMLRRAGRFAVLATAISVLVFFLLFQQGLLSGLITEFVGALRNQDATVLVYGDQARQNVQASVVAPGTVEAVAGVEGVAAAGPLGVGTFTVETTEDRTDATLFGYGLGGPGAPTDVADGRLPDTDGEAVASSTAGAGFELGDEVQVLPDGPTITVVGVADDLAFSVTPTLFVSFATYEAARLAQNPEATTVPPSAVAVAVTDGADPDTVASAIDTSVEGVEALTRDRAAAEAPGVEAVQQSFAVILLLGYVVVAVVIGFFFLILTTQKSDQLTLLRALGVTGTRLVGVVLTQVVLVVLIALLAGGALAVLALASGSSGISAGLAPTELAGAGAIVAVLALVGSIGAVRRIRRLDPARAVDLGGAL